MGKKDFWSNSKPEEKRSRKSPKQIQDRALYENSKTKILKVKGGVDKMLRLEETWWSQIAKSEWLKEGDKNTKNINITSSQMKNQNTISKIQDKEVSWVNDPKCNTLNLNAK